MTFRWFGVINAILILLVLTKVALSFTDAARHSKKAESSNDHHECRDCARRKEKANEEHSHQKLISIRTEMIKNQILQKLRLSKPPEISNATPLMLKEFLHTDHPSLEEIRSVVTERKSDEFFGKIINVAVLPEIIATPSPHSSYSSALLSFRLKHSIIKEEMLSADLWFYNINDGGNNYKHRMTVWELVKEENYFISKQYIAANKECNSMAWEKVQIDIKAHKWVPNDRVLREIEITCRLCDEKLGPIGLSDHNKPFLIIHMNSTVSTTKSRRSSTCSDSNSFGCCKQPLYVNFTDIGWGDWIIQPSGYMANYCRGSCINDVDMLRWNHTSVMREVIVSQEQKAREMDLGICCSPSKMSSISMIYRKSNQVIIDSKLENMVVEECDCV